MALLLPFINIVLIVLSIIRWIVLVWVILSWILFFASQTSFRWRNRGVYHVLEQLNDIFSRMTWPFLRPIRRVLRRYDTAGIDWSPLVLLLIILLIQWIIEALRARFILMP
jgi:YggT family protein